MKFLKANLILIICTLVVLLSIGALYYPIGAKSKKLRNSMIASLGAETMASSLGRTFISIPGEKSYNGPVTPQVIKAKEFVQLKIAQQADWVQRRVETANAGYRVSFSGSRVMPLLNGVPMRDLLPRPSRDAVVRGEFRSAYRRLFLNKFRSPRGFLAMLDAGTPPTAQVIKRLVRRALKKQASIMPVGEAGNAESGVHSRLTREIVRRQVYRVAAGIKMYASPGSFQIRRFIRSTTLPTADQIYEAFVDTWVQADVVRAIAVLNRSSTNVGESPIKRLIHITVGNQAPAAMGATYSNANASGNGMDLIGDGHLFLGASKVAQATGGNSAANAADMARFRPPGMPGGYPGGPGGYPGMLPNIPSVGGSATTGVGAMLTGHVSNARYQVVLMQVSLVAEPWMINKFINQLYHQNNGYIVLNMDIRTVDPIQAITQGFVYGKVPAVRADLLFECVMFSRWNKRVMPADYRSALGLASTPAAQ